MKNLSLATLLLTAFFTTSSNSLNLEKEYFLFVGEPGAGKSTIINSLMQKEVATSREIIEAQAGWCSCCREYEDGNRVYVEIPSFWDKKGIHPNIQDIKSILKKEGKHRLFFVLRFSEGRVSPDDMNLIYTVMDAIGNSSSQYNIIFNNINKRTFNIIINQPTEFKKFLKYLNDNTKYKTESIGYLKLDQELWDDNKPYFTDIDENFKKFFYIDSKILAVTHREIDEYLLFVGGPGVGKSTIINSIFGELRAKAGVNPGTGITTIQEGYNFNGKLLIDTPGLSDIKTRAKAAKEIENSLKYNGKYRIFFVLQLSAGRIRNEDVSTITTVMDAINIPNVKYNVLFNKVTRRELIETIKNQVNYLLLINSLNSGKYKTDSVYYIMKDHALEDGDSEFINIDSALKNYIFEKSLMINIQQNSIKPLDVRSSEEFKAESENLSLRNYISGNEMLMDLLENRAAKSYEDIKAENEDIKLGLFYRGHCVYQ